MSEITAYWRIYLIAIGSIAATCGLVFYAMGRSYAEPRDLELNTGIGLMVGGMVLLAIGIVTYARRPPED